MYQSRLGVLFIALHTPLPSQVWNQSLPQIPAHETKRPPSGVHTFLFFKVLSFLEGLVCVLVVCFVLVNEVRFVQFLLNKCIKMEKHCLKQPLPPQKKRDGGLSHIQKESYYM